MLLNEVVHYLILNMTLVLEVKMCCSTVSVDSLNSQFIGRVSDNSINPYDLISIVKMKSENTKRICNTSKSEKIEFKANKYGPFRHFIIGSNDTAGGLKKTASFLLK